MERQTQDLRQGEDRAANDARTIEALQERLEQEREAMRVQLADLANSAQGMRDRVN